MFFLSLSSSVIDLSSSPPSYELQEEGPVQQISYVSDTERGYCRVISEDELDFPRFVLDAGVIPQTFLNSNTSMIYSVTEEWLIFHLQPRDQLIQIDLSCFSLHPYVLMYDEIIGMHDHPS